MVERSVRVEHDSREIGGMNKWGKGVEYLGLISYNYITYHFKIQFN